MFAVVNQGFLVGALSVFAKLSNKKSLNKKKLVLMGAVHLWSPKISQFSIEAVADLAGGGGGETVATLFMTYFYRAGGGGHDSLGYLADPAAGQRWPRNMSSTWPPLVAIVSKDLFW